jgi:heme A synthase
MGEVQPRLSLPGLPLHPSITMVTNPWINRITAIVVLLAIYAAGYAGGRDAATMARLNHPACHGNLKP